MRKPLIVGLLAAAVAFGCASIPEIPAPAASPTVKVLRDGGHGSGVHIGNGFVITSAHVIETEQKLKIKLDDGRTVTATALWSNRPYDVALLKLDEDERVKSAPLTCRKVEVGEVLVSRGNPGPIEFVQTYGRVAGLPRKVGSIESAFVFDGTVVPGMSGGGVFDARGSVVGINAALMAVPVGFGASLVPVSYIVPSSTICMLMARKA